MFTLYRMSQSADVTPAPKLVSKLIVLYAFRREDDGALKTAFEPREMPHKRRAMTRARELSHDHVGVITWSRGCQPAITGRLWFGARLRMCPTSTRGLHGREISSPSTRSDLWIGGRTGLGFGVRCRRCGTVARRP